MDATGTVALDPRLSMLARLVGNCDCCADIGCDHGRLGAFLLQSGQCRRVVLSDVSEPSLAKARRLIGALGLADRATFCVADGVPAEIAPQAVVIAGMGGETIAGIIERGRRRLGGARLVLQPNVAAPALRGKLSQSGYAITDERAVQDGRRCYIAIQAEPGESDYGPKAREVGPVFLEKMPGELLPYARFRLRVAEKALNGARAASDAERSAALVWEVEIWREVLACLQR